LREKPEGGPAVDALFSELLRAGESASRVRDFLAGHDMDELEMIALLRRAVPVRFLESVGTQPPWSEKRRVLGVVRNPRTPRPLALRLVPALFWHDLAEVAASAFLTIAVRARAEALLVEMLPQMRLGERITLAKIATPALLPPLLADAEAKVTRAALANPRLREEGLVVALRQAAAPRALLEETSVSARWRDNYASRLALVLQPRTPLGIALAQISSFVPRDLRQIAETSGLRPLVQAAALRAADGPAAGDDDEGPAA
jgi:hypothetical protein